MATKNDDLAWKKLNPASLTKEQQTAYTAYKDAYKKANDLRKAFTDLVTKDMLPHIPANKKPVFSFKYGNLSIAMADRDVTSVSSSKNVTTLADYLKQVA